MQLDIRAGVIAVVLILVIVAILTLVRGFTQYREARSMRFFAKKKEKNRNAFGIIFLGVMILVFALLFNSFAEPVMPRI